VSPWRPPGSVSVTVDGVAMYVLDGEATLVTCEIDMPDSRQLVRGAVDAARRCEASSLQITISPDYLGAGPAIEELRRRGAIRGTDDILAADLAASAPHIRDRPRVEVIEVSTFEQVVEFERTSACGWGYPHPSAEAIQGAYSRLTPGWFLGSLDGEAAGTAGFALVGVVARLWGGAVVPAMRVAGCTGIWSLAVWRPRALAEPLWRSSTLRRLRHPSCNTWAFGSSASVIRSGCRWRLSDSGERRFEH
jgi:hypothetical protein